MTEMPPTVAEILSRRLVLFFIFQTVRKLITISKLFRACLLTGRLYMGGASWGITIRIAISFVHFFHRHSPNMTHHHGPSTIFRRDSYQTTDAAFGYGGTMAAGYRCSLSRQKFEHMWSLNICEFNDRSGVHVWEIKWPVCMRGSHAIIGKQFWMQMKQNWITK